MTKGARVDVDKEIEQSEIEAAVTRSGYPLEIRLLEAFEGGGMAPRIGTLVRFDDPSQAKDNHPAREIDIVASLADRLPVEPAKEGRQRAIHSTFDVLVAAKSLAPSAALVGFTWKPMSAREQQMLRCSFGGGPTTVVEGYPQANQLAYGENGLADAFAPL